MKYPNKFKPQFLDGDAGEEYGLLYDTAKVISSSGLKGLTCEIGVRLGGGTEAILQGLLDGSKYVYTHIAIDPYGELPYYPRDNQRIVSTGYDLNKRSEFLFKAYKWSYDRGNPFHLIYLPLTAYQFTARFYEGVPVYYEGLSAIPFEYVLTHIDGQHTTEAVFMESLFFGRRTIPGGYLILDNIDCFNHEFIKSSLLDYGFEFIDQYESPAKSRYRKR